MENDKRLLALKEGWRTSGKPQEGATYLRALRRIGRITDERLVLAVYCGSQAARLALAEKAPKKTKTRRFWEGLSLHAPEAWRHEAYSLAMMLAGRAAGLSDPWVDDNKMTDAALEAADAYLCCPCWIHQDQARKLIRKVSTFYRWQLAVKNACRGAVEGDAENLSWVLGLTDEVNEEEIERAVREGLIPWALEGTRPFLAEPVTPTSLDCPDCGGQGYRIGEPDPGWEEAYESDLWDLGVCPACDDDFFQPGYRECPDCTSETLDACGTCDGYGGVPCDQCEEGLLDSTCPVCGGFNLSHVYRDPAWRRGDEWICPLCVAWRLRCLTCWPRPPHGGQAADEGWKCTCIQKRRKHKGVHERCCGRRRHP